MFVSVVCFLILEDKEKVKIADATTTGTLHFLTLPLMHIEKVL